MKLKIIEAGWEGYTGSFGMVEFEGGVSVGEVSQMHADRLASLINVVVLDGEYEVPTGPAARLLVVDDIEAPHVEVGSGIDPADVDAPASPQKVYTLEELSDIADASVPQLREIALALGVKSKSISGLISGVLEAQKKVA